MSKDNSNDSAVLDSLRDSLLKKSRVRPMPSYIDEVVNGRVVRKYCFVNNDYSKPFTPQSGLEAKVNDIGFMCKTNVQFEHKPSYLSKLSSTNPFDLVCLGREVKSTFETAKKNVESYNKKEK